MATPHINAQMGDFADVVLMPGDPLRAKYIAENFLDNAVQGCDVRNMFGYRHLQRPQDLCDGAWYGYPILLKLCNRAYQRLRREKIIRVGSCGAVNEGIKVRDVVNGMGACTDSKVNRICFKDHDFAAIADYKMVKLQKNLPKHVALT